MEPSKDGTAALVVVPVSATSNTATNDAVADLREQASAGAPDGVTAQVTGPAAISADLSAVFDGADVRLLLATAGVVALLLLLTYRSPVLWLIPLTVVAVADRLATVFATQIMAVLGVAWDASTTGILSVLVFGAGTDYALLLISRYRDELKVTPSRNLAMARALRRTAEAVLASATTVFLGLLTLLLSLIPTTRGLGLACAIGIVVAAGFVLLVLPAFLVLFGRWVFWPKVPARGRRRPGRRSRPVAPGRRPGRRSAGGVHHRRAGAARDPVGRSPPHRRRARRCRPVPRQAGGDRGRGATRSSRSRPGSRARPRCSPATTRPRCCAPSRTPMASPQRTRAPRATASPRSTPSCRPHPDPTPPSRRSTGCATRLASYDDTHVGGSEAEAMDERAASQRDRLLIFPLVLLLVLGALLVLLRSVVAPLLLVATVLATYGAAMGASWWIFTGLLGFDAIDVNVPLFSFIFLVALGVDYNIFLVTRARQEAVEHGSREGMLRALTATGGVITSAGILLAAVFAVLGVLPLVVLAQIGTVICVGVLLDTLLVRTVLVPALALRARRPVLVAAEVSENVSP